MNVNLKSLIGKLNHPARTALESAAGLCLSRTHYNIEIEHYLAKLLDQADGDFETWELAPQQRRELAPEHPLPALRILQRL